MCDAGSWSASLLGFNGSAASLSVGNTTPRTSSASYSSLASLFSSGDFETGSSDYGDIFFNIRNLKTNQYLAQRDSWNLGKSAAAIRSVVNCLRDRSPTFATTTPQPPPPPPATPPSKKVKTLQ